MAHLALADISVLRKWKALFRGLSLFISGNLVVAFAARLNIGVKRYKQCSSIKIKCGSLLHTCHNIDTGPAVSILVSSNFVTIYHRIDVSNRVLMSCMK